MDKARRIEKKYVPNAVCWPVAHRCSAAVGDCRRRSAAVGGGWRAEGAAAGRWGGEGAAGRWGGRPAIPDLKAIDQANLNYRKHKPGHSEFQQQKLKKYKIKQRFFKKSLKIRKNRVL